MMDPQNNASVDIRSSAALIGHRHVTDGIVMCEFRRPVIHSRWWPRLLPFNPFVSALRVIRRSSRPPKLTLLLTVVQRAKLGLDPNPCINCGRGFDGAAARQRSKKSQCHLDEHCPRAAADQSN
jgi:hypothetical protein